MCKNALSCRLSVMSEIGHREREKAKRRLSIEISALRLFAEKGFEETTIQEIAAAASVSPRTVLMYFPNKADIALSSVNMEVAILTERLRTESKKKSVYYNPDMIQVKKALVITIQQFMYCKIESLNLN